ncbi:MAG: azr 2 [Myxococcaceae bacterium]|nr:azr 2 [Myxococcaceae bacterium]
MRLLGISGSLRTGSSNHAVLRAIGQLDPSTSLSIYDGVARLPHFSPDLDIEPAPAEVASLRAQVRDADALLICSPEYAHGIPGSLKNALDWLVSSGEIMDKHVVLWGSGEYAYDQLIEVLRTLTTNMLVDASRRISRARQSFDAAGRLTNPELASQLTASLVSLKSELSR